MSCIEEASIRQLIPLVSIIKLSHGNTGWKGNTTCMWNQSKLCTILPSLPSTCQYFVLSYETRKSLISLKLTKFERIKIQRFLELLSCTVEWVWKEKNYFKIESSQEHLEKWPEHEDIRHLDDVVSISIPKEITQSDKSNLEDIEKTNSSFQNINDEKSATLRNKAFNLFTDGKDAGPSPLQNKDFPEETFETTIVSSNTKSSNIHDTVIAQKKVKIK